MKISQRDVAAMDDLDNALDSESGYTGARRIVIFSLLMFVVLGVWAWFGKIILLVPLIYIMPAAFGGLEGAAKLAAPVADLVRQPGPVATIFLAESVSDVLAALSTSIVFAGFYRKRLADRP